MSSPLAFLAEIDLTLFYWLNVDLANPFLDVVMPWITEKRHWYLPGGLLWLYLMIFGGRKGRVIGVGVIVAIIAADQLSAAVLKPLVGRGRPCKILESFRLLAHCGSFNGFPSSHATNIAALGGVLGYAYPRWRSFWIMMILLIGMSRVYVGVHYPLDVVAGWLVGAGIALVVLLLSRGWMRRDSGAKPE